VKSLHVVRLRTLQWGLAVGLLCLGVAAWASPASRPVPKVAQSHTVLVMGDSLSAAHGLADSQGWVALMGPLVAASKPGWRVVNASISGETSSGGAARVAHELALNHPAVLVIELGANDALRGLPMQQMHANLAGMISAAQGAHAKVLLIGMRIPPNYGQAYTKAFEQSYRDLARECHVALLPFLLEPIARDINTFQADDLHPVAGAEPKLRDHVWQALQPLLN
jgi:acyl-CoA thioesterase-1